MNTNALASSIDTYAGYLGKLYGLPGYALVALSCIVVGYALRWVRRFPNDGIPLAVILWGALFTVLVAEAPKAGESIRIWLVRNVLAGLVVGLLAWLVHKALLSRLEDWLSSRYPGIVESLNKPQSSSAETPQPKP